MLDCHVNAFLVSPGRVMGRRLRPLTLAHLWLLEASGNPFAFETAKRNHADTVAAVLVVSLPARIARWMATRPRMMRLYVKCFLKSDGVENDIKAAEEYFAAYKAHPARIETKSKGRSSCLPASVNIAWAIMGKVGERRAWSMPLPLAMTYLVAESEANGGEYISEHDKYMAQLNANFGKEPDNG